MKLQIARYLAGAAIAAAIIAVAALAGLIILRGGVSVSAPSIAGLIGTITALGTLLTVAFGGRVLVGAVADVHNTVADVHNTVTEVQGAIADVQEKVNGHLQQHVEQARAAPTQAQEPPPPPSP